MTIANVLEKALEDIKKHNLAGQLNDAIADIKHAIDLDNEATIIRQEQWKAWAVDRAHTITNRPDEPRVPTVEIIKVAGELANFVNNPELDFKRVVQ